MVVNLDQSLGELVAVNVEQSLAEIERNSHVCASYVFECVQQNFVRILVVSKFLFLAGDVDSDLHGLAYVSYCAVQLKGPLRLLWNIVRLPHQVVN